ncbi:Flagellar transcriptional regulator FlhD [Pararobbsia alpina]|jgi:flagellar transcriptional activator FlhD|uniref:flagellar transcriptional regulator FlhD n=1 Tax=Pararobbsia alpina TaxID=621374 RepID=UPI0039A6AED2
MNTFDTQESIREVNLSYLMLAQHMLREDRAIAMFRLGLSADVADTLIGLSPTQIMKLAACNHLLCAFRFNEQKLLAALTQPSKQIEIASAHAAILMAGHPVELTAHPLELLV